MDALYSSLAKLEARLLEAEVSWAVIGGLAVAVWGEPRLTRDVDVKIALRRDNLDRLLNALGPDYRPLHGDPHETAGTLGILFVEDGGGTKIDLMLADMDFDLQAIARAKRVHLGPATEPMVCSAEDLVIYKLISSRPRDYDDALSVIRRQGAGLDRGHIQGWLEQFEMALDDSTLVSTFQAMLPKPRH